MAAPEANVANDPEVPAPVAPVQPVEPAQKMAPMKTAPVVLAEEEEEDMNAPVPAGATCVFSSVLYWLHFPQRHR